MELVFLMLGEEKKKKKKEVKGTRSREIRIQELLTTPLVGMGFFQALTLLLALVWKCAGGTWCLKKDIRLQASVCLLNLKP